MAVKKVIDVWKAKQWYHLVAPKFLGEVHTTLVVPATEEATLLNRVVSIPLKEITREFSHVYTTVRLRISEIKGKSAFTKFIGHSVAREFLTTLARRRRDALELHLMLKSKDGVDFQLSALIVTAGVCSEKQKKALRNTLASELRQKASAADFGDFARMVLFQQLLQELHNKLSKIYPLKRVEITKTELYEEFDVAQPMEMPQNAEKTGKAEAAEKNAAEAEAGEAQAGA